MLFRKGAALQGVAVVAVDKTGTLTEGRPVLTEVHLAPGFSRDTVLAAVAAVEAQSEHPVARAIGAAAGLVIPEVEGFAAMPGFGVSATVSGQLVVVGADRQMARLGLDVTPFAADAARLADAGARRCTWPSTAG